MRRVPRHLYRNRLARLPCHKRQRAAHSGRVVAPRRRRAPRNSPSHTVNRKCARTPIQRNREHQVRRTAVAFRHAARGVDRKARRVIVPDRPRTARRLDVRTRRRIAQCDYHRLIRLVGRVARYQHRNRLGRGPRRKRQRAARNCCVIGPRSRCAPGTFGPVHRRRSRRRRTQRHRERQACRAAVALCHARRVDRKAGRVVVRDRTGADCRIYDRSERWIAQCDHHGLVRLRRRVPRHLYRNRLAGLPGCKRQIAADDRRKVGPRCRRAPRNSPSHIVRRQCAPPPTQRHCEIQVHRTAVALRHCRRVDRKAGIVVVGGRHRHIHVGQAVVCTVPARCRIEHYIPVHAAVLYIVIGARYGHRLRSAPVLGREGHRARRHTALGGVVAGNSDCHIGRRRRPQPHCERRLATSLSEPAAVGGGACDQLLGARLDCEGAFVIPQRGSR